jgi:hypothetical protein
MDVRLPNGAIVKNIPEGTSKEELKAKLIANGVATEQDFVAKAGDRGALDFLDVGTGLGGALAGAAAGTAILPGVGTVIGGILGGAAGTFGGEVAEDVIAGGEIDLDRATESTAMGAAFDVATLGLGKVIRPLAKMTGLMPSDITNKLLPTDLQAYKVGTKESLQQTEQLLSQAGGGLSAQQAGATGIRKIAEQIGDEGILSGSRTLKRVETNADILRNEMQRQIDGGVGTISKAESIDEVGRHIYDVINAGRKATMDLYEKGLNEIIQTHGRKSLKTKAVNEAIESFEKDYATSFGSTLSKETRAELNDIKAMFAGRDMSVKDMIEAQKVINRMIRESSEVGGAKFNSTVEHQLMQLNEKVGNAIEKTLKTRGPGGAKGLGTVGTDYSAVNKMYADNMKGLLPEINKNVVQNAKVGSYDQLGKLLVQPTSAIKVEQMMKSIDTSFAQMKAAGLKPTGIKSAKDAKKVIRQSYLAEFFKEVAEPDDIYKIAARVKKLDGPTQTKRLKSILGDDYVQFKSLLNAIAESKPGANQGIFNLALRSREAGIVTSPTAVLGVGATAGVLSGVAGAAAVFAIPEVLGRIATNRKAVARLLDLNKKVIANPDIKPELVVSAIGKVFEELSETDRQSLSYALKQPSPQNTAPRPNPQIAQEPMAPGAVGDVNQPEAMRQALGL